MSINAKQPSSRPQILITVCPECLRLRHPTSGQYFMDLQFITYGLPDHTPDYRLCPECAKATDMGAERE